uniref:Uncharacterized protein n=1 Tax=Anguilla anguilla TaxID=7936 RepID=A0A0E9R5V9_ANGAN
MGCVNICIAVQYW